MLAASLIAIAIVARTLYMARWLGRFECMGMWREGVLERQLHRRVGMEQLPRHVANFPVPREERMLVTRLFGVVVWHREVSVALPISACGHLEGVDPRDFDGQFPSWLRVTRLLAVDA